MNHTPAPGLDPEAARESLDQIAASRRAAAQSTRRPAWLDATLAGSVGAAILAALLDRWALAVLVLVVGAVATRIAQHLTQRRRGQIVDPRTLRARVLAFAPLYAALVAFALAIPPGREFAGYALVVGGLAGIGGFAWLRWEDRYTFRRLVADDNRYGVR